MASTDTFQPYKRTLGELLASTNPPLRVPDYQRDYSWDKEQTAEFWEDLIAFGGSDVSKEPAGEYFLGATVLVDNGSHHLVLDGQQRLATATMLLAALRNKLADYKKDAAQQLQDQFIVFQDALTGVQVPRLELNIFDRGYFRERVQAFPMQALPAVTKRSHQLIDRACSFFASKIEAGWNDAGDGKQGFRWASRLAIVLRGHIVLITAVSSNQKSASSIFTALNDRGIGLSTVDLVRSQILQRAPESQREQLVSYWNTGFEACGNEVNTEALMRISWVSQYGDLKTRALYKVISGWLDEKNDENGALEYSRRFQDDALLYRRMRDGDTDDPDLEQHWLSLRPLKFNSGYPLLIAAAHQLSLDDQRKLAKALTVLVLRHNTVCNLDRASLESVAFACAKDLTDGNGLAAVIEKLRKESPGDVLFSQNFLSLSFGVPEHGTARYLLTLLDQELAATAEIDVAGADRVHVEHIYPQTPMTDERWQDHDTYVKRLGNLTLLDKRLNIQIKNSVFPEKKAKAYNESQLAITRDLLKYDEWSPERVNERQARLLEIASAVWPQNLIPD